MPGIWRSAVNAAGLLGMPNTKGRVLVVVDINLCLGTTADAVLGSSWLVRDL